MSNYFSSFSPIIFILKLDEPFGNQEIYKISLCSTVQIYDLRAKVFLLIFCPSGPDPWIRIFSQIRIQGAKFKPKTEEKKFFLSNPKSKLLKIIFKNPDFRMVHQVLA